MAEPQVTSLARSWWEAQPGARALQGKSWLKRNEPWWNAEAAAPTTPSSPQTGPLPASPNFPAPSTHIEGPRGGEVHGQPHLVTEFLQVIEHLGLGWGVPAQQRPLGEGAVDFVGHCHIGQEHELLHEPAVGGTGQGPCSFFLSQALC